MPKPEFFTRLGLLVIKDFFDSGLCESLRIEARKSAAEPAEIDREGRTKDEDTRKTQLSSVSGPRLGLVNDHLRNLRNQLEIHFNQPLVDHQAPQFLIYKEGDFYRPHRDSYSGNSVPGYLQSRRITVVIFLNSQSEVQSTDVYTGGSLTLYGLIDKPAGRLIGFPMEGVEGTLVAFPADTVHEVECVSRGCRISIVSWFY
jgi:predicted 2-oxoglutarate/Fe(II)-dependent dioxygenase YbiX